ncbi:hypothetical protein N407_04825 [Helicobacter pylori FD662]|nr:hypothetical protein N407_04825 [Helicobacter pylori FD662]
MRNYRSLSSFILIIKNTQRHQFDYQHSIKNFYRLYKMRWNVLRGVIFNSINRCISKIFVQQNLKLAAKKTKKLIKSKGFKKAVAFKRDSPNTGRSDRELKA